MNNLTTATPTASNTTTPYNGTASLPPYYLPYTFWAFLSFETIIIIFGNLFCVHLFLSSRKLRKTQTLFIVSLCTSDLLVGLAVAPCEYCRCCRMDDFRCPMFCGTIISFNMIASVVNLVLICTDRYVSIKCPYKYRALFTKGRTVMFIAGCWALAVLLSCLPLTWMFMKDHRTGEWINVIYAIILFSFTIVAAIVLTIFYCDIVRIIRRQQSKEGSGSSSRGVMVCIISSLVFAISWIPYTAVEILYQHSVQVSIITGDVAYFILLLSPCVDPIIYAYYRKDVRGQIVRKYSIKPHTEAIVKHMHGMLASLTYGNKGRKTKEEEEEKADGDMTTTISLNGTMSLM